MGNTLSFENAVRKRDFKQVNALLQQGDDPFFLIDDADKDEQSAIGWAFDKQDHAMVALLMTSVQEFQDFVVENEINDISLLHYACWIGDLDIVKDMAQPLLLSAGNDEGGEPCRKAKIPRDNMGATPLHYAARQGHYDVIVWLLDQGLVDVNDHTDTTRPPLRLTYGTNYQHTAVFSLLLKRGADPELGDRKGITLLHELLGMGHLLLAGMLLGRHPETNVNAKDDDGNTPLCYAAFFGQRDALDWLLINHSADPGITNEKGELLIHHCADRPEQLRRLLERGIFCGREKDKSGRTPLHLACAKGNLESTKALFELGSVEDYDEPDGGGCTPLAHAVARSHVPVIKFLLEKAKADRRQSLLKLLFGDGPKPLNFIHLFLGHNHDVPDVTCAMVETLRVLLDEDNMDTLFLGIDNPVNSRTRDRDYTPMHMVSAYGMTEFVVLLRDHGAQIHAKTSDGMTPLHFAAFHGHLKTVQTLMSLGADVTCPDNDGETPLHSAIRGGHLDVIDYFLEYAPLGIHLKPDDGRTALHLAVAMRNLDLVRFLLNRATPVDEASHQGVTPLGTAVLMNLPDIAQVLLDHGACMTPVSGISPLHLAAKEGRYDIMQLFLKQPHCHLAFQQQGALKPPLHEAVIHGHTEIVGLLTKDPRVRETIDARTPQDHTALRLSVILGHQDIMRRLVDCGANPRATDAHGNTLTHDVAEFDRVNLFLENEAWFTDVTTKNADGKTPFDVAVALGNLRIAEAFLRRFPDLDLANTRQHPECNTPLHTAIQGGHLEMVKLLCDHRADQEILGKDRKSVLHLAAECGHAHILDFFLNGNSSSSFSYSSQGPLSDVFAANGARSFFSDQRRRRVSLDDVNRQDGSGRTPLYYATLHTHMSCVEVLMKYGANPFLPCSHPEGKGGCTKTLIEETLGRGQHARATLMLKYATSDCLPDALEGQPGQGGGMSEQHSFSMAATSYPPSNISKPRVATRQFSTEARHQHHHHGLLAKHPTLPSLPLVSRSLHLCPRGPVVCRPTNNTPRWLSGLKKCLPRS